MSMKREPTLPARLVAPAPDIEDELQQMVRELNPTPTGNLGNSADMSRVQELLNNAVTAAHADTCKAIDKVTEEARALMDRLEKHVEAYKKQLQDDGQKIAAELESAVKVLRTTVEWAEERTPELRNPKL